MCSNIGTPNNHHFPFGTNGKVVVLGVPILKHFRVCTSTDKHKWIFNIKEHDSVETESRVIVLFPHKKCRWSYNPSSLHIV